MICIIWVLRRIVNRVNDTLHSGSFVYYTSGGVTPIVNSVDLDFPSLFSFYNTELKYEMESNNKSACYNG